MRMNNWNGVFEIMSGLNMGLIQRLRETWKVTSMRARYSALQGLPPKYLDFFLELSDLTSPDDNWKAYRSKLAQKASPFLPHLGLFLRDLTFTEDGNLTFVEKGVLNWRKMTIMSTTFRRFRETQESFYGFSHNLEVLNFLKSLEAIKDEKDLYSKSKFIEPPRGHHK